MSGSGFDDDAPTVTPRTRDGGAAGGGAGPAGRASVMLPASVGPYRVGEILGRGGMGVVARGHDERTGRDVALKILDERSAADESELLRVEREGRLLSAIRHPNVALLLGIEDVGSAEGAESAARAGSAPVLVLELIEGPTLSQRIAEGPVAAAETAAIGAGIAAALAAAHARGIVHRDLKPGNVKLSPSGVKVLDFGLAARDAAGVPRSLQSETTDVEASGLASGTPGYMSPEQIEGIPASAPSDVWALGCVLFEMATGRKAFRGASMAETFRATLTSSPELGELPAALREIVAGCLRSRPESRPSASEVATLLGAEAAGDASAGTAPTAQVVTEARGLPRLRSSFLGRRAELADLRALVQSERLTTLTGAGGSGKTRVALEAGLRLQDDPPAGRFADGVSFVELATLAEASLLAEHVAHALGVADRKGQPALEALTGALRERDGVLILDNCEHLLDEAADLVARLVEACPRLSILATSREPLRVAGERVLPLPPLRVPLALDRPDVERLVENESVALFADRARASRRGFRISEANASAVTRCCRRLDGMPLALELAAARLRHVTVDELAEELEQSFAGLTGGSAAALPRHQALRATIDWSVDHLEPRELTLHRRLGVFAGPFMLPMAEEVAADDETLRRDEVIEALALLQEKSLVQAEDAFRVPRWRLLEPIRRHAAEALEASGEAASVRRRFVKAVAAMAEASHDRLEGSDLLAALADLSEEHVHLVEAARLAPGPASGDAAGAAGAAGAAAMLRALGRIGSYFVARSIWREGRALMDALMPHVPAGDDASRAPALLSSGQLCLMLGEIAEGESRAREAAAAFQRIGDEAALAEACNTLSQAAWERVSLDEAREWGERSLALRRKLGLTSLVTNSLNQLGLVARSARDLQQARCRFEEALAIQRETGNAFTLAVVLINLSVVTIDLQDFDAARPLLREALQRAGEAGSRRGELFALTNLAQLQLKTGETREAGELLRRAAPIAREAGDRSGGMSIVLAAASVAFAEGEPARAARFLGVALALREASGAQRFHDQESFDRGLARGEDELGAQGLQAELAAGRGVSFDDALLAVERGETPVTGPRRSVE